MIVISLELRIEAMEKEIEYPKADSWVVMIDSAKVVNYKGPLPMPASIQKAAHELFISTIEQYQEMMGDGSWDYIDRAYVRYVENTYLEYNICGFHSVSDMQQMMADIQAAMGEFVVSKEEDRSVWAFSHIFGELTMEK
jgi:ribose 5-phosphate isomerase